MIKNTVNLEIILLFFHHLTKIMGKVPITALKNPRFRPQMSSFIWIEVQNSKLLSLQVNMTDKLQILPFLQTIMLKNIF